MAQLKILAIEPLLSYVKEDMKIKQKYLVPSVLFAVVGMLSLASTTVALTPSQVSAASLTTWQKFIKKKCKGQSADAAERCASKLEERLKKKCGAPKENDTYINCWRDFINNNGGSAGPDTSPFETETPTDTGGTGSGTGNSCGGVDTAIINCDQDNNGGSVKDNAVWVLLTRVSNILSA